MTLPSFTYCTYFNMPFSPPIILLILEIVIHVVFWFVYFSSFKGREIGNEKLIGILDLQNIGYKNIDARGLITGFQFLQVILIFFLSASAYWHILFLFSRFCPSHAFYFLIPSFHLLPLDSWLYLGQTFLQFTPTLGLVMYCPNF